MLAKTQSRVGFLEEENALLRQRLFGRKSEQTADPATLQLALFDDAESIADVADEDAEAGTGKQNVRKVYSCRDCEAAPATADKPTQVIEKHS